MNSDPLPITIIGGYLGAGKTTLVNHLLRHAAGVRLAVLVNEFGELPIDQDLIEAQDDKIISIAGGCVCCSYGNDLTLALMDLNQLDPAPDHVLLESSGVAIPNAIAASVSLLAGYVTDGIVILADAETIQELAIDNYVGDTIMRQLDKADLVVVSKCDLVTDAQLDNTVLWLQKKAPGAEIITSSYAALPPSTLLQTFLTRDNSKKQLSEHHTDIFKTNSWSMTEPVDARALAQALAETVPGLVRAKGFVTTANGESITLQVVGRRWTVTPAPNSARNGLVTIGQAPCFKTDVVRALLQESAVLSVSRNKAI